MRIILRPALLALSVAIGQSAAALVGNYSFAANTSTYATITGTVLVSGTWDDTNSSLVTLPFTFTYNNVPYTTVGISTNGFITLGAVTTTVYCGLQTGPAISIAGFGTDLVNASASSSVRYGSDGSAPNRRFIVQWTDCDHYNNSQQNHLTFQVILYETSNNVQVVFGPSTVATTLGANTCADTNTESGNVGLLGASTADFNIRKVTNGSTTWSQSTAGQVITDVCNLSPANLPANGLTWTWTPPPSVPMVFSSSTTAFMNNGQVDGRGSQLNNVLRVNVVTAGNLSPLSLTSLSLSTTGCTNAATDLSSTRVYYTAGGTTFSTGTQFGSTANNPNGSYSVSGSVTLQEGNNYFWVCYDVRLTATLLNTLTGCCTQVSGPGAMGAHVPTVTCPAGAQTVGPQLGTWTPLASQATQSSGGLMLLLSDGTVMAKSEAGGGDGVGSTWLRLTPSATGSYVNGTWSTMTTMGSTRLYFSSQVLKDGRVYVAGGEYGTGLSNGEVYDPVANTWTNTPAPGANVSDANSIMLEDGRVLQALVAGSLRSTVIYNPANNSFAAGPTCLGIHNESSWVKLPDNSVLFVDRLSTNAERYIPASNSWIADATVPVQLYDPFGDETGPGLMLPDGRAFFIGSLGHTAFYTPSGSTANGIWQAGPDVPNGMGAPDAAAALMANGKVLCAVSPAPTSADHFPPPTAFYEFDPATNQFSLLNAPGGGTSANHSAYVTNMLDLPDGNVLYDRQGSTQYYVYQPAGSPVVAAKPAIASYDQVSCGTYRIKGTQFNGVSEGAYYGDDWQMSTNYPLVRLTSGSNVYYARTFNWNSTGVARGNLADSCSFTLPAGIPNGTYAMVVVANGIASDPVSFVTGAAPTASITISSGTNPTLPGAPVTFIVSTHNGGASPTYQWKVNGGNVGTNSPSFTTSALTDGQVVTCVLTSNLACASPTTGTSNAITMNVLGLRLSAKVFLEGPFDGTSLMNDGLRSASLIPLTEPYTALGYVHVGGGGESVAPAVLAVTGTNAIVDWVVVEVRDANTPANVLATKSALLQRDGDVVATDGTSPVSFTLAAGSYHVALRHRNHLGVMTGSPAIFTGSLLTLDFTLPSTTTYGINASKPVNAAMAMWAGNVTLDDMLIYVGQGNDRDPILARIGGSVPTNTTSGYYPEDVNLDGVVKYVGTNNDRDPILSNVGGSVPTNIRTEQLP
ncbi:MAG: kelch repeat-containing protein [Flavobacteriales bacterium]